MKNEDVIKCIKDELKKINDEIGELRDAQIAANSTQVTMQADIEWLKKLFGRVEKEVWAILVGVFGAALAFWFFK